MSWDGMLIQHNCERCGLPLNPNGVRPAELYAGTYTGLCYSCERQPEFCSHVELLDRAQHWEFPPHCPSYRRWREKFVGYAGCEHCNGTGAIWVSRPFTQGGPYRTYCEACFNRYYGHPVRVKDDGLTFINRCENKTKGLTMTIQEALAIVAENEVTYLKYVRVGGEYRFVCLWGDHISLVSKGETAESAGMIKIYPDHCDIEGYSMTLKIGSIVEDYEELPSLFNRPIAR